MDHCYSDSEAQQRSPGEEELHDEVFHEEALHDEEVHEEPLHEEVVHKEAAHNTGETPPPKKRLHYDEAIKQVQEQETPDHKLHLALEFMERFLAHQGSPQFKEFWEIRRFCLSLFKDTINPTARSHLWDRYCDLSREARRLKEIFDERALFAMEQIEIAIKVLENELSDPEQTLHKVPEVVFVDIPHHLHSNIEDYIGLQRHLALLNAQAARIDALREELVKTEMRIRHKNQFFERLSHAGDQVFPIRKELIKNNSVRFMEDVDDFLAECCPAEGIRGDLYALREEVKSWQSFAKQLTLNTYAFTHSRRRLGECWDKIRELDKERKKWRSQQKAQHRENAEFIDTEITTLKQNLEKGEISLEEIERQNSHIQGLIRRTDLDRNDVHVLREHLKEVHLVIDAKQREIKEEQGKEEKKRHQARAELFQNLKEEIHQLLGQIGKIDIEEIQKSYHELAAKITPQSISRNEHQQLERQLKGLRDGIAAQRDKLLFASTHTDEGEATDFEALQRDLKRLQLHRQKIKEHVEELKKKAGSSGLDFAKAIELNELLVSEKDRLEKANAAIHGVEAKLRSPRAAR